MSYERVVSAALAETASKFRLAEALALDIPRRREGGSTENEQSVDAELTEARQRVIDAGGEPRSVVTLKDYRTTALWVMITNGSDPTPAFRWIPGVSYSAHAEARRYGFTYDKFAALPAKTTDALRKLAGRPGTDGKPAAIASGWTPEEKAEVVREALADPVVADKVQDDAAARRNLREAERRRDEEIERSAGFEPGGMSKAFEDQRRRNENETLSLNAWMLTVTDLSLAKIKRELRKLADDLSRTTGQIPAEYREDILADVRHIRVSADFIETAATRTGDWDAAMAGLGEQE